MVGRLFVHGLNMPLFSFSGTFALFVLEAVVGFEIEDVEVV